MTGPDDATRTEGPAESAGLGVIGPYRLLQKLGEGGMGTVFQAEQSAPVKRTVALKVIKAGMDTHQVVARFESERQALALMSHPGIAKVLDAGATADGRPFFVMELVPGAPLTDYCDATRMPTRARLALFIAICEAVQHAHQKGIIHRDLKPSNILVTMQDGKPVPKIIDFGIAKATSQKLSEMTLFTEIGTFVGTPAYMSPEQFETTALDIDTRSDVYSLGVMLYELLTGTTPLDLAAARRAGLDEIRRQIREDDAERPSTRITKRHDTSGEVAKRRGVDPGTLVHQLRGDLDWIVLKALEKDRTRRYASASELAADIGRHLRDEPVLASPPSRGYRMRKFVRRHRVGVAAASVVVVALVAGVVGTTMGLVRARRAEALAKVAEAKAREEAATAQRVSNFLVDLFEVSDPGEARGNAITARELLDRGAGSIRVNLGKDPLIQARLMGTMGAVYRKLGLYKESRPLLEESLATFRSSAGEDDPRTLDAASTLAGLLILVKDTSGAARVLDDTCPRMERVFGPDSVEAARCINNRAAAAMQERRFADALPLLERALAIREKRSGPDSNDVAKQLTNLGNVKQELKDFEGARRDLERAIAIRTKVLGPDHPDTVNPIENLGLVLDSLGDHAGARARLTQALDVRMKILGPDHPDTVRVRGELAALRP